MTHAWSPSIVDFSSWQATLSYQPGTVSYALSQQAVTITFHQTVVSRICSLDSCVCAWFALVISFLSFLCILKIYILQEDNVTVFICLYMFYHSSEVINCALYAVAKRHR